MSHRLKNAVIVDTSCRCQPDSEMMVCLVAGNWRAQRCNFMGCVCTGYKQRGSPWRYTIPSPLRISRIARPCFEIWGLYHPAHLPYTQCIFDAVAQGGCLTDPLTPWWNGERAYIHDNRTNEPLEFISPVSWKRHYELVSVSFSGVMKLTVQDNEPEICHSFLYGCRENDTHMAQLTTAVPRVDFACSVRFEWARKIWPFKETSTDVCESRFSARWQRISSQPSLICRYSGSFFA